MRRSNSVVLVAATLAALSCCAVSARAELSPASRIGPNGVGPIVVGMTPAQAARTGTRFAATAPAAGSSCFYLRPPAPAGLTFMVEAGTIRRAEMRVATLATTDGFRVGDPLARLTAAYGTRAHLTPDKYDAAAQTLTVMPHASARKFYFVYKISRGKVNAIFAGAPPQIDYVEGCS